MMQFGLIGIGAGAAAALLFASVTSGSWLSILLFYLAPLPIMIAGLGWSHWAALIAALTGALALGLVFGTVFFFAFLAGAGIPAWWLGYLAMLARPPGNGSGAAALEWYPPGRLVVWAAVLAALIVVVAIPNFGTDAESFRAGLRSALARMLHVETGTPAGAPLSVPGVSNADRLIDFLVAAIPPAAAVLATITNVLNLWLAARIVKFSGLLKRPWPQLSAMTFPRPLAGGARHRHGLELCRRPGRHRRRRAVGEPADGLWRARLCGAACHHARHGQPRLPARRRLCRGDRFRLAGAGALPARPESRPPSICARAIARKRGPPGPYLRIQTIASNPNSNQHVQIEE